MRRKKKEKNFEEGYFDMSDDVIEMEIEETGELKRTKSIEVPSFHYDELSTVPEEEKTHLDMFKLREDLVASGDLKKTLPKPGFPPITVLETSQGVIAFSSDESCLSPSSEIRRLMNMVTRESAEKFYFQGQYRESLRLLRDGEKKMQRMSERLKQQKRALSMMEQDVVVPSKWVIYDIEGLVNAVNAFKGPKVKKDRIRGYGLFADRDYQPGELVTKYGGRTIWNTSQLRGDYVAKASEHHIDGFDTFRLSEKGRWINEFDSERTFVNCSLGRDIRAIVLVKEGEQFFCNYGNDYERNY